MQKEAKNKALKSILLFVAFIYLYFTVIKPYLNGERINSEKALEEVPVALIAGLIYFFILYYFEKKYPKQ